MSDILCEYVREVLTERYRSSSYMHANPYKRSTSPWGKHSDDEFSHIFIAPIRDAFETAAMAVDLTGTTMQSMVERILSRFIYLALPDKIAMKIIKRVEQIDEREHQQVEKIYQQYSDVIERNTTELFQGDAAMFAFFAAPAEFIVGTMALKAPDDTARFLGALFTKREFRAPETHSLARRALQFFESLFIPEPVKRVMHGAAPEPVKARVKEARARAKVDDLGDDKQKRYAAFKRVMLQPELKAAIDGYFADGREAAQKAMLSLRSDVIDDAKRMLAFDSIDAFDRTMDLDVSGIVSSTIDNDDENADVVAVEEQVLDALKKGVKDAYIKGLQQRAQATDMPAYIELYEGIIEEIKAL